MATFGDSTANAMMNVLRAAGLFVSLHSADPGKTGADELTNIGYARQASTLGAAAGQQIANSGAVTFGPAGEEWDEAAYFGLWSAASAGTFIAGAALTAPVTVPNAGSATFDIADLILSLDAIS